MTKTEYIKMQGKRIKAARVTAGLTQGQLAAAITEWGYPISRGTISNIELGKEPSRMDVPLAVADICGSALVGAGITDRPLAWLLASEVDRVKPG